MLQSIQSKLVALVAGAIALLAIAGFWGIQQESKLSEEYRRMVTQDDVAKNGIDQLNLAFKTQVQEWKNLLLRSQSSADVAQHWQGLGGTQDKIQRQADDLITLLKNTEYQDEITQFKALHQGLIGKYAQARDAFAAANFDPRVGDTAVKGADREASKLLLDTSEILAKKQQLSLDQLSARANNSRWQTSLAFVAIAVCLLVGLTLVLSKLVMTPIHIAIEQIGSLAAGNFNLALDTSRSDEIGQLYRSLEKMKEELGGMIAGIRTTADALLEATRQLNESAGNINQDTASTENFAGQIAAAINEMASTVNEVARNAAHAAEATSSADKGAREGLTIMTNAIASISRVADEVAQTSSQMSKLKDDSTSVGAVLDVIKGIAEQTNLLALNAAIEAARAGEQGRGFAVVADEVRALAKRTQESTEEIQQIIKTLQDGAAGATQAMLLSTNKTREAVQLAEKAGGTITDISTSIGMIRDMNNQIAAAAEEQSVAAEEINRNVVSMSGLAENAHVNARKTGSVGKSLEQTSRDLHSLVAGFRI